MLTPPTTEELTAASGAVDTYSAYATQALYEATLLLQLSTGITEWPADELDLAMAKLAVCKMADLNYLEQLNRELSAQGKQSESFPEYSYTLAAKNVHAGTETGIVWWDMAVKRLTVQDKSRVSYGGRHVYRMERLPTRHRHGSITWESLH